MSLLRAARLTATLLVAAAFMLGVTDASQASPGLSVNDLNHGVSATDLANAIAGGGVTISNVTYTGDNRAAGTFSGGSAVGFDSGIVLGSGNVETVAGDDPCARGVEGPNNCYESTASNPNGGPDGAENSTSFGTPGDADLTTLSGFQTFDAAVLEFDFVPQTSSLTFSYVFSSDEYSDFSNTSFNDVFAFFVNGNNCALVPGTTDPVSVNTINDGNDVGGDATTHHPELFRDNVNPSPSIDTQMDGLTTVLTCTAAVTAGQTNHMKLAIADASDSAFDSAVFIQAGSFASTHTLTVSKAGSGSGTVTSSPSGINCGATCSASFAAGTMVTLTAAADAGSTFTGWSGGGCSGTGTCTVTMSADQAVTATFTVIPVTAAPLSLGYWKNHESATTALLPVSLGAYAVGGFSSASSVFAANNCKDAVGCLAAQLLAAKLNVKNGAGTCISGTISAADAFLVGIAYVGPSGTYTLSAAQRDQALALKDALDAYNNGSGC